MRALTIAIAIATMTIAPTVDAQTDIGPRWKGWCEYKWSGNRPPPRLNLPTWACEAAFAAKLHTRYSVYTGINPFFLSGDFNGDGKIDIAIWVTNTRTRQRGIVILHQGNKNPVVIGAGVALYERGEDYKVFDMWSLIPKGEVLNSNYEDHRKVVLQGDAIGVMKSESSAHALYWDGSKYVAYTLSD